MTYALRAGEDRLNWFYRIRREQRQHQSRHLARCGGRCVQEALEALDRGAGTIDSILADFTRLEPETYHACLYFYGADDEALP